MSPLCINCAIVCHGIVAAMVHTDPPVVELLMEPNTYVVESDAVNVTLMCRVISGNPLQLTHVKWLLDGNILKELPECTGNGDDALCGVDPDILLLENVGRHFLGNYSCRGQNSAGEGHPSTDKELIVFYEPGAATLLHYPLVASKKKAITLFCSVEDGGYPNATQYVWLRDGNPLPYDTALITFENIGLDSRANFSCYAQNKGGKGQMAHVELDVLAPPSFIQNLQPRTAALFSAQNISLSCRVECVPLCTITWYKNGFGIEKNDDRYVVSESFLSADKAIGDFESVLSTLYFNMSAWPDQQLDIHSDNANYSCVSSANSEGPGVRSSTDFHVECMCVVFNCVYLFSFLAPTTPLCRFCWHTGTQHSFVRVDRKMGSVPSILHLTVLHVAIDMTIVRVLL